MPTTLIEPAALAAHLPIRLAIVDCRFDLHALSVARSPGPPDTFRTRSTPIL